MALFTTIGTALGFTGAAATVAGVATTAAVGYGAYSMMNQPKSAEGARDAQMPKAPTAPKQADSAKIAQQQATDRARAAARSKSVMTNPLGTKDEATVVRKKLL